MRNWTGRVWCGTDYHVSDNLSDEWKYWPPPPHQHDCQRLSDQRVGETFGNSLRERKRERERERKRERDGEKEGATPAVRASERDGEGGKMFKMM